MKGGTQHTFFQNSSMGCQNVKLTDSSQKSGNTCKMCLILCSTVSFHTALSHSMQCIIPYSIVSFHTVLSHSILCCLIPYGVVSFHAVSHSMQCLIPCSVSFLAALSHSMQCLIPAVLSHSIQHCLIPCSVVSFHTALSHSMQCCLISYGVVSFHAVLSHSIRHCLIPCSVVSFHTVLSHSLQCCQYPQVRLGCGFPLHLEQGKQLLWYQWWWMVFLNMLRQLVPQVLSPVEVWARAGLSIVVPPACCRKLSTRPVLWGQAAWSCGTAWVSMWWSRGRASGTRTSPHYFQVVRFPFTWYSGVQCYC